MNLKPEVTRILVREKMVSETALARLIDKSDKSHTMEA